MSNINSEPKRKFKLKNMPINNVSDDSAMVKEMITPDKKEEVVETGKNFVNFTEVKNKKGEKLTKELSKNLDGTLCKSSANCILISGKAKIINMPFYQFPKYLKNATLNQAIIHGVPNASSNVAGKEHFSIINSSRFYNQPNTITRTKENFAYPSQGGCLTMIDYDAAEGQINLTPEQVVNKIGEVFPEFLKVARVINFSTSSCIYEGDKELRGKGTGCHIYFPVKDGSDISRFAKVLFNRLWLAGHGYVLVSKSGSLLVRSIIDISVFSPERLDFIAPAFCLPPLEQRKPDPLYYDGNILDTSLLGDLSSDEDSILKRMIDEAKSKAKPECDQVKTQYIKIEVKKLLDIQDEKNEPLTEVQAQKIVNSRMKGNLDRKDVLYFDTLGKVLVEDVLANPDKYNEQTLSDPLEPDKGDCKAKFFMNTKGVPIIHSFLHGERNYYLINKKTASEVRNEIDELLKGNDHTITSEQWFEVIKSGNLEHEDVNKILEYLATEKVGTKRELNKEYKDLMRVEAIKRQNSDLEKRVEHRQMIKYSRHDLNSMLKDAETAMIEVPSKMEYFQYGGALAFIEYDTVKNYMEANNFQHDIKIPNVRLYTQPLMEIRMDQSLVFFESKKAEFGLEEKKLMGIPQNVIKALLENPKSLAPVVSGILSHPTILFNGKIICDEGYDKHTGLFLTLGGKTFAPIPDNVTKEDAVKAIKYLESTLFSEFCFHDSPVDTKDYSLNALNAVSLLLTGVVRKIIDLAPAYLVNASIQGSGKTTVVRICHILLTGCDLPVSSFGGCPEEMKKEMLSTLSQSPTLVCYDNVLDGSELKGQTLSQVITSSSYKGRVLGLSKEITVPTNTVFTVTGNNVTLCSDLLRRFMSISLGSDIERPETRVFKHPNIVQYCLSHRTEVLNACLIIIKSYIDNGKQQIEPKDHSGSGFPQWDQMVRFPILFTTGIDIVKSMDQNREQSTENTATVALIENLYNKFQIEEFKAHELFDYVEEIRSYGDNYIFREDPIKENLREAIRTLASKGLTSVKTLAWVLKSKSGRVVNGKMLIFEHNSSGNNGRYHIVLKDPNIIPEKRDLSFLDKIVEPDPFYMISI